MAGSQAGRGGVPVSVWQRLGMGHEMTPGLFTPWPWQTGHFGQHKGASFLSPPLKTRCQSQASGSDKRLSQAHFMLL